MGTSLFSSSIGKKIGMAVTGLLLYGFLLGHMAGNLLLLKADSGAEFNAYSEFLTGHPLLVPVEIGLVAIFLLHVYLAISVSRDSKRARNISYVKTRAVGKRSAASYTMIYSGIVILVFVVLHLKTFKYGDLAGGTLYDLVVGTFSDVAYVVWYVVAMLVLGFHLWHAFHSAFQSLGWSARPKLKAVSVVLGIVIAGGFGIIPLAIFFNQ